MTSISECDRQLNILRKELDEVTRSTSGERWPEEKWKVLEKINAVLDRKIELRRMTKEALVE